MAKRKLGAGKQVSHCLAFGPCLPYVGKEVNYRWVGAEQRGTGSLFDSLRSYALP